MRFSKMHGIGNDYVYIDAWRDGMPADPQELATAMSDRHTGVGSDGLIIVAPPQGDEAQARMIMYNADGSESEMCGNGIRCAAKLAYDHGHVATPQMRFETGAGILDISLQLKDDQCIGATVQMGVPRLKAAEIPINTDDAESIIQASLESARTTWELYAVGMGNPHAVCFLPDVEGLDLESIGPTLEHASIFPNRSNIEFCKILSQDGIPVIRQRTWERGSGETQACGTGACATAVAAMRSGQISSREAIIRLNGGNLHISWPDDEASVQMSGAATHVFDGDWPE